MREFRADLHIHTCLSPCAEPEMSPAQVVRRSCENGLHLIAICDHNSGENVEAVRHAAKNTGLVVASGIEICTREEVHVLGIFEEDRALELAQNAVYSSLNGENDAQTFGEQLVMNEHGEVVGYNHRQIGRASCRERV